MRKYTCKDCGRKLLTIDLEEQEIEHDDLERFSFIWAKAGYELSVNQKIFCVDVDYDHYEIDFQYSGRNMFGRKCPAIRSNISEIESDAEYSTDQMGRGYIFYAQR